MVGARRLRPYLGYRAEQVMRFIDLFIVEHDRSPTYLEIRRGTLIGTSGEVSRIIKSLENHGIVKRIGSGRIPRIHRLIIES